MDTAPMRTWLNQHWRSVALAAAAYFFLAAVLRAGESPAGANLVEAGMTLAVFLLLLVSVTKRWLPALLIMLVTLITEAIGVLGYLPFGPYGYGGAHATLGVFGVPLFIPVAWAVIVIALARITRSWWKTGLAALAMDILFEPVAAAWGLWTWSSYGALVAPLLNYAGWFIVAAAMYPFALKAGSERMHAYGVTFLIIFHYTVSAAALGLPIAYYGIALLLALAWLAVAERRAEGKDSAAAR